MKNNPSNKAITYRDAGVNLENPLDDSSDSEYNEYDE